MAISIDDRRLVEAHKAGDPAAFADLVRNHRRALMGHAVRRLHDQQAAEDAVQETLLRAYRALPRFNGEYKVAGWLHRILENVCADEGNRRKRESLLVDRVAGWERFVEPAADQVIGLELPRAELAAALARLPRNYQEALVLRFVDELPYDELAQAAGVTEDNARARVHRARAALRRALGTVAAFGAFLVPLGRKPDKALAAAGAPAPDAGAASTVSNVTNAGSVAGAGVAAQLAPVASEIATGSSLAAHKLAMAIGLAAAVAVPSGVHLTQSRAAAPPPAPAAVPGAGGDSATGAGPSAAAGAGTSGDSLTAAGEAGATAAAGGVTTETGADAGAVGEGAGATDTDMATGRTTAPATGGPGGGATDPVPTAPVEETAAPRGASLVATDLRITEAGPRLAIEGAIELTTDDGTVAGTVTGRAQLGAAAPKDPEEPRRFDTVLTVTLDDGRTFDLRLVGLATVVDDEERGQRTYSIEGAYQLTGAEDVGVDPDGDFTARLVQAGDGTGSLELVLADGPAAEGGSAGDGEVTAAGGSSAGAGATAAGGGQAGEPEPS